MKFTKILKNIIAENVKGKYLINLEKLTKPTKDSEGNKKKPLMTKEVFDELVKADPTTKLNDVELSTAGEKELEKVKAGSYVIWLVKKYLTVPTEIEPGQPGYERELKQNQSVFLEDLYKVTNDLKKFERFKNRIPENQRNIDKLSVQQLYELVKDFSLEKTKATKEEKKVAAETYEHPGGEIAYRGNNWTVAKISDTGKLGKDAACFYGGNYLEPSRGETRWCTSSPGLNWFDRYIKDGPLYVVIPNKYEGKRGEVSGLPAERYQFHFQSNQFMDVHDHSVNLVELLNGPMSELKEYFKPEFAKGVTVGGTKFAIDSFTSGAVGKFVALYGVEDLFESLPAELEEFQINNRDRNDILVKIPEDIGKFKNLRMILLENCVSEIPNSVCELTKLRFIALINNPQLKTIPGCLINLPNLTFINLKGSPNVEVPEEIKARATDVGGGMWDLEGED
jgi:Leucine-rich repeat (LRR) protein